MKDQYEARKRAVELQNNRCGIQFLFSCSVSCWMETREIHNETDCKGEQGLLLKRTLKVIHLPSMKSLHKNIIRVG